MENIDTLTWFMTLAPLSFSPGPANVLFAAMGGAFGIRASLPFLVGTNLVCIFQSLAAGFGLAAIITSSESAQLVIKWCGILVLVYLALRFFRSKVEKNQVAKPLSFREGVLVELFNAKFFLIPIIMFSLFYDPVYNNMLMVPGLTLALATLTVSANLLWVAGGRAATAVLEKTWFARHQGKFFGSVLMITAVWLAIN
jgi:threonine/homoserine/homoserine lactone efflux protein